MFLKPLMGQRAAAGIFSQCQLAFCGMIMGIGVFLAAGAKGKRWRAIQRYYPFVDLQYINQVIQRIEKQVRSYLLFRSGYPAPHRNSLKAKQAANILKRHIGTITMALAIAVVLLVQSSGRGRTFTLRAH